MMPPTMKSPTVLFILLGHACILCGTAKADALHEVSNFSELGAAIPAAERTFPAFDKVEEIGVYDIGRLNKILTTELKEFSDFEVQYAKPKYAVKLYRVTYQSVIPEQNNRPVTASGPRRCAPERGEGDAGCLLPTRDGVYQNSGSFSPGRVDGNAINDR